MQSVIYFLSTFLNIALSGVLFAMFLRMLAPLIFEEENKFESFLWFVTEPFIIPVRAVMVKFNILQDTPIDFSFLFTSLFLSFILMFIG